MESNQVHLVAFSVSRDLQQIIHALEPRFAGQILRDVGNSNRRNRIHDDVALIHPVTTAHLYMGTRPDTNTARDYPEPDPRAKAFCEHHLEPHPMATSGMLTVHTKKVIEDEPKTRILSSVLTFALQTRLQVLCRSAAEFDEPVELVAGRPFSNR